jgi:Raf kinase inhibitor-like YbhB/YbcL family protein
MPAWRIEIKLHTKVSQREGNMTLILTSTAFENGGNIPGVYTCQGEDISPPLSWCNIPQAAKSLALIVDDPDAPDPNAPRMTWVHWLLYNIPPATSALAEHMTATKLPPGTLEGINDWKRTGYGGPCPPIGRHRYFFKLYALDTPIADLHKPVKNKLEAAMQGHIIAQTQLMGTYQK